MTHHPENTRYPQRSVLVIASCCETGQGLEQDGLSQIQNSPSRKPVPICERLEGGASPFNRTMILRTLLKLCWNGSTPRNGIQVRICGKTLKWVFANTV